MFPVLFLFFLLFVAFIGFGCFLNNLGLFYGNLLYIFRHNNHAFNNFE